MTSFEDYLVQHKIKNLQPGDKVRYIGEGSFWAITPNEIYTFLELQEFSGILYAKIQVKNYNVSTHIKNIIKV